MDVEAAPPGGAQWGSRLTTMALWAGLASLLFVTFRPFFSALLWSAVLSYWLYPLYSRVVKLTRNRRSLSALVMSLGVTVGLILPLAYLSFLIGKELARTYLQVVSLLQEGPGLMEQWRVHPLVAALLNQIQEFQRMTGTDLRSVLVDNLAELGSALVEQLTQVARNVLLGVSELGIILLSTFYFFRDGKGIVEWIQDFLPLGETRQQLLARRFDEVVKGAVIGNTFVAALEGIVGGLTFWLIDMPAPLLWGAVMGILAYLPLVGAAFVWLPVAVVLFIQGSYGSASVLCVAGVVIAILDYVVRTVVVGEASKLHTLLTFFGVLGGIQFFGLVGIVAGPLVVAITFALLESYRADQSGVIVSPKES